MLFISYSVLRTILNIKAIYIFVDQYTNWTNSIPVIDFCCCLNLSKKSYVIWYKLRQLIAFNMQLTKLILCWSAVCREQTGTTCICWWKENVYMLFGFQKGYLMWYFWLRVYISWSKGNYTYITDNSVLYFQVPCVCWIFVLHYAIDIKNMFIFYVMRSLRSFLSWQVFI